MGAGAIGNEVAKNLALLGIGKLVIIDCDRIEISNLSRSLFFRKRDIGRFKSEVIGESIRENFPATAVETIVGNVLFDVGLGRFAECDLILGCVDNREARLWVNRSSYRVQRPWIDAGIHEIHGVIQAFAAAKPPCYECGMKEIDYRLIGARYRCQGQFEDGVASGHVPTTPTIASIVAAWQSQIAMKILHGLDVPYGQSIVFNGITDQTYQTRLPERAHCLSHEVWSVDDRLPERSLNWTIDELFQYASERWGEKGWRLHLERRIATFLRCPDCGNLQQLETPQVHIDLRSTTCHVCSGFREPFWVDSIDQDSHLVSKPWTMVGIPRNDRIRLSYSAGSRVLEVP